MNIHNIAKRIPLFLITLILIILFTPLSAFANNNDVFDVKPSKGAEYQGYIVKLKENSAKIKNEKRLSTATGISEIVDGRPYYQADTLDNIKANLSEEDIAYIEPNYIMYFDESLLANSYVNDPNISEQWGLDMTRGFAVWNKGLTASNATVGVIDSGLYTAHEDINTTYVRTGKNFVTGTTDTSDPLGHGTQVTSVIAATNNNNKGISSLGYRAHIVPLKVDSNGSPSIAAATSALYAAADTYDCDVVNMSFGGSNYSQALKDACDYAAAEGVLLIAATGNSYDTVLQYPANYDTVIGVGAITIHGVKADFSTYNSSVYVTAPGENIYLVKATGLSAYGYNSGTSFSSPYVASLAALAKAYNPNMTLNSFKTLLRNSAVDKGVSGYDTYYGYGLVDAGRFVYYLTGSDYFSFTDMTPSNSYYPFVSYGVRWGYMRGTGTTTFSPSSNIIRADMVTMLGRHYEMRGGSIPKINDTFSDTVNNSYYSKYVAWSTGAGIISGTTSTTFSPQTVATREMLATVLYRYAQHTGVNMGTVNLNVLNQFTDKDSISNYAKTPMAWAVQNGLMSGTSSTKISPKGNAPRNHFSKILYNYCQAYASF